MMKALSLRKIGRLELVVFAALPAAAKIDLQHVHLKELEIVGACNDLDLFNCAMAILPEATPLVTHRFALADYRQAIDLAENGRDKSLKIAFEFPDKRSRLPALPILYKSPIRSRRHLSLIPFKNDVLSTPVAKCSELIIYFAPSLCLPLKSTI